MLCRKQPKIWGKKKKDFIPLIQGLSVHIIIYLTLETNTLKNIYNKKIKLVAINRYYDKVLNIQNNKNIQINMKFTQYTLHIVCFFIIQRYISRGDTLNFRHSSIRSIFPGHISCYCIFLTHIEISPRHLERSRGLKGM